jgi:hypothetical protein
MNLREFWAAEAAKLRDTSAILGVPNVSEATPTLSKSMEDLSNDSDSVTVCIVPGRWQNDFDVDFSILKPENVQAVKAEIKAITMIAQAAQFTFDIFIEAYNTNDAVSKLKTALGARKIDFLVIASHGGYKSASFELGSRSHTKVGDEYVKPNDILTDTGMQQLAKMVGKDCRIAFTACHMGRKSNGGQELLKAVSRLFKCTVYGNQSWGTPSGRTNNEFLFVNWKVNHNTPVIQDWTKYTAKEVQEKVRPKQSHQEGYTSAGKWTRCLYDNGHLKIEEIYNAYFMYNGMAYSTKP